ncbi:MAG: aspartate-semialdehyde dehydrogenase [Acidobacteria bacterium]|nr:aspartate-semialdehyde dehydrogenase [Acidobacteriota bacterium]MCB9397567.1 aspartate-semialdehyde dehydrogenase [Acidobacteriota bacterium]
MTNKKKVGILGATGAVGQRFIQLLENHPQFEITALAASEGSAGKTYQEAVTWRMETAIPENLKNQVVQTCVPEMDVDFVLSALPSDQAKVVEPAFAQAGFAVVSNASTFRMHSDVPLMIPEVNPGHSELIPIQRQIRGWKGFIVTNPNCVTVGLALPLKALHDAFEVTAVNVVTFQARSGAGYPGPPPELIDDNVLPYIGGEEEKVESEPQKILGQLQSPASFKVSAQCTRVNVSDGHFECLNIGLKQKASIEEIKQVLANFSGVPQQAKLYSAPQKPIWLSEDEMRPQPKLDRDNARGMAVTVGRVRSCPILDVRMAILSHNTIRGAAGAALLNAELLLHQGYL